MASTPVEFRAPSGLTLTLEVYPYGSDTIGNTGGDSATEATNRKGLYSATVTEALTGWHTAHVKNSGTVIAVYDVYMADDTEIHRCHDLPEDAAIANADTLLTRDWTEVAGEAARSVLNALRFLRNKWSISGSTLTVTEEDDSTTAWTSALTSSDSVDPVTASDPS